MNPALLLPGHPPLSNQHLCSLSGDEFGSSPARPSTYERPESVPSPVRDQSGSAFGIDEDSELFFSDYKSEADTNKDCELFLSDYESEADANSEAANSGADINFETESEAKTGFSSSYSDNPHPDPSWPLLQFTLNGADLWIRLRGAIEVYVPSQKRTIRFSGEVLAALAYTRSQVQPPESPEYFPQTSPAPPRPASPGQPPAPAPVPSFAEQSVSPSLVAPNYVPALSPRPSLPPAPISSGFSTSSFPAHGIKRSRDLSDADWQGEDNSEQRSRRKPRKMSESPARAGLYQGSSRPWPYLASGDVILAALFSALIAHD